MTYSLHCSVVRSNMNLNMLITVHTSVGGLTQYELTRRNYNKMFLNETGATAAAVTSSHRQTGATVAVTVLAYSKSNVMKAYFAVSMTTAAPSANVA